MDIAWKTLLTVNEKTKHSPQWKKESVSPHLVSRVRYQTLASVTIFLLVWHEM